MDLIEDKNLVSKNKGVSDCSDSSMNSHINVGIDVSEDPSQNNIQNNADKIHPSEESQSPSIAAN